MDALLPIVILAAWQRCSFVVNGVANLLDVLVRVLFFFLIIFTILKILNLGH